MLGLLIVFAISWPLLWLFFRDHITVLGIIPTASRSKGFVVGLIVMAVFCTINTLGQAYFTEINYVRNPNYGVLEALKGSWWTIKAAMLEELLFRGAILYILIKKFGVSWACLLSAIAFGIYHWFSYEMFERGLVPMIYVFLLTGAAGWMFAYAFAKTKSILVPLGLHFGWILMSIVFFSAGPLGESLWIPDGDGIPLSGGVQLLFFLWQTLFVPGSITWYLARRYKPTSD